MAEQKTNEGSNAQDIRSRIFQNSKKVKSEKVTFFGEEVEVRQPRMKDILGSGDDNETSDRRLARMIVMHTYVPGTNERVFEDAHIDEILEMPFGGIQKLNDAMNRLMGINVNGEQGNSEGTTTGST